MDFARSQAQAEWLAAAARLIVEDGLEYGAAKHQAAEQLGLPPRTPMPDNDSLEEAVREHIALFCADEQAGELRVLRERALVWMHRLEEFRPYIAGAVWNGTATRHSDIYLHLFADDTKSVEWRLLDKRVSYHPGTLPGNKRQAEREVLTIEDRIEGWPHGLLIHLVVMTHDDMRGALKRDGKGRSPLGTAAALAALLNNQEEDEPSPGVLK